MKFWTFIYIVCITEMMFHNINKKASLVTTSNLLFYPHRFGTIPNTDCLVSMVITETAVPMVAMETTSLES